MDSPPPVVAVTGASGYIGCRLLQELEAEEGLSRVVAIDTKPLPLPFHNVTSERMDATESLKQIFLDHHVNAVVHLAFIYTPGRGRRQERQLREANLKCLHSVLAASLSARVASLIYVSSHTVYGAHRDNPVPITEETPLRTTPGFQYGSDKALCEGAVLDFSRENPQISVSVLRSCVVLGPGADNYVTRAFFKPLLLRVTGYDPPLQFVHQDDLARLLRDLIMHPAQGTFNVAGEGVVHYSRLARLGGRRLLSLPSAVAYPLTQLAWNLGIQRESPAAGLDFVRYPLVMSTGKLKKETGFRFTYSSEEALMSYLPQAAS